MAEEPEDRSADAAGADEATGPFSVSREFAIPGAGSVKPPALVVLSGEMTGVAHPLAEGDVTLGREPECGVFLGDRTVSRHHAEISVGTEHIVLRDLGSLNGTYLNRRRIEGEEILHHGDEVQVGKFRLGFVGR